MQILIDNWNYVAAAVAISIFFAVFFFISLPLMRREAKHQTRVAGDELVDVLARQHELANASPDFPSHHPLHHAMHWVETMPEDLQGMPELTHPEPEPGPTSISELEDIAEENERFGKPRSGLMQEAGLEQGVTVVNLDMTELEQCALAGWPETEIAQLEAQLGEVDDPGQLNRHALTLFIMTLVRDISQGEEDMRQARQQKILDALGVLEVFLRVDQAENVGPAGSMPRSVSDGEGPGVWVAAHAVESMESMLTDAIDRQRDVRGAMKQMMTDSQSSAYKSVMEELLRDSGVAFELCRDTHGMVFQMSEQCR